MLTVLLLSCAVPADLRLEDLDGAWVIEEGDRARAWTFAAEDESYARYDYLIEEGPDAWEFGVVRLTGADLGLFPVWGEEYTAAPYQRTIEAFRNDALDVGEVFERGELPGEVRPNH